MKDLTEEDWKNIASKVSQYAIMGSDEQYSEFVFTMYADYIDISAESLSDKISEKSVTAIKELAESIRYNCDQFRTGNIAEIDYTEGCFWISLEAMIKLLSSYLTQILITAPNGFFAQEYALDVKYEGYGGLMWYMLGDDTFRKFYDQYSTISAGAWKIDLFWDGMHVNQSTFSVL